MEFINDFLSTPPVASSIQTTESNGIDIVQAIKANPELVNAIIMDTFSKLHRN